MYLMNSLLDNSYKVSSLIWLENVVRLTFNAPISTKVVCFSRLLKCLRSLYGKQCGIDQTAPKEQSVLGPHCLLLFSIHQ